MVRLVNQENKQLLVAHIVMQYRQHNFKLE